MSAFEAHVINVTAHIENALKVFPSPIKFGTVFPQEHLEKRIWVTTSESFCAADQRRVLNIDYKIAQKPKPRPAFEEKVGTVEARQWCHDNYPKTTYDPNSQEWVDYLVNCYPSLCPYLSKIPVYADPKPYDDHGITSFHDPNDPASIATGTINKDKDLLDEWIVDLDVPCFKGQCAQDWIRHGWELPPQLESQDFGCDLWIEIVKIY